MCSCGQSATCFIIYFDWTLETPNKKEREEMSWSPLILIFHDVLPHVLHSSLIGIQCTACTLPRWGNTAHIWARLHKALGVRVMPLPEHVRHSHTFSLSASLYCVSLQLSLHQEQGGMETELGTKASLLREVCLMKTRFCIWERIMPLLKQISANVVCRIGTLT